MAVFTLDASNIKGIARKFACSRPVWIGHQTALLSVALSNKRWTPKYTDWILGAGLVLTATGGREATRALLAGTGLTQQLTDLSALFRQEHEQTRTCQSRVRSVSQ